MARTGRPREFDRAEAVHQAMLLFWANGYEPTSLADLRKELGDLSAASFYKAFGSKDQLFEECLELYMSTCGGVAEELDAPGVSPRAAMQAMLTRAVHSQTSIDQPTGCMAVLSGMNCGSENDAVNVAVADARNRTRLAMEECLARAVENGDIADSQRASNLLELYDVVLKGIALQARDGVSREALLGAVDACMAAWDCAGETKQHA
ncbi:TetR/AcrR family transcriptional regulator [Pseudomonas kurunegalensis]|uniref:TetR/AcrR family transcriptional regulator n=1 Tax=Pseudomonas kurunegalensis TaxID=485880 RepID=UPI0025701709|nr:TetR/AcrR family transcriptional regulator [Pseudomonas kurunegalensis]WJD65101.1 TetR/AcrR family transcriptional regulator [Pseudomonas kurunegalensis]